MTPNFHVRLRKTKRSDYFDSKFRVAIGILRSFNLSIGGGTTGCA